MDKKYVVSVVCAGALMLAGGAGAVAYIEGAAQTEVTVESSNSTGTNTGEITTQTNSKLDTATGGLDTKIDSNVQVQNEITDKDSDDESVERVLPTVNKKTEAKVQVRGWDAVKKEQIEAKVQATLEVNPQIRFAEVAEESVTIIYSAPGKFLGVFPMNFNLWVMADVGARVKVRFPWYRFLLKTEFANTAELLNGVFQQNQTNLEFLKSKASQDRQVEIFITISNSLKIMHDMSKSIIQNIKA